MDHDLTPYHAASVNRIILDLFNSKLITKKLRNHLCASNCRTAKFYLLPKVHKRNIPGRPIVSATNCPTEKLSALVDLILNPLVLTTRSYILDTTDFLNKISQVDLTHIDSPIVATMMDVVSLYTNIPEGLGLRCIAKKLRTNQIYHCRRLKFFKS